MAESNMAEFKMADIIKVESEWMSLSQSANGGEPVFLIKSEWSLIRVWKQRWLTQLDMDNRIQDGCNHQLESEWTSEVFLCKMAESKMAVSESNGWQNSR